MRGVFFYSVAFAANTVVASVCKPRPRGSDSSTLLLSTLATNLQDVTTTTILVDTAASTSVPISSDATFTSLPAGITTNSDLSFSTAIDTGSEETGVSTRTTSTFESVDTSLIDATTSGLSTATEETATSKVDTETSTTIAASEPTTTDTTTAQVDLTTGTTTTFDASASTATTETHTDTTTTDLSATTLTEATSAETSSLLDTTTATSSLTTFETSTSDVTTTTLGTTANEVSTTEAQTTTTAEATTTTSQEPWQPLPTFDLAGIGSPLGGVNGHPLSGELDYDKIGWNQVPKQPTLHFTIEPETGYLKTVNSYYVCAYVYITDPEDYRRVYLCSDDVMQNMPILRRLTCEQKPHSTLQCSTPAMSCIISEATWDFECTELEGDLSQFYVATSSLGDFLTIAAPNNPPIGPEFHRVELGITVPASGPSVGK